MNNTAMIFYQISHIQVLVFNFIYNFYPLSCFLTCGKFKTIKKLKSKM